MPGAVSSVEPRRRAHGCDRVDRRADVLRAEPAGEHDAAVGARRRVPVLRVGRPPRAGRARARRARPRAAAPRRGRAPCRPRRGRAGRGRRRCSSASPTKTATESDVVRHVEHRRRAARALSTRMKPSMSAPASTAASTSSCRVSPQTFTSGRESSSRSFAPGSGARISAVPTRIASAPASSAAAPCARVWIALSAITTRSRGARATSSSCALRSIAKVERSRALTPMTGASSRVARASSSAS